MESGWLDARKKVTLGLLMIQGVMIAFAVNYIILQDFSSKPNIAEKVLHPTKRNDEELISQVKGATTEIPGMVNLVQMTTDSYKLELTIPDSNSQIYGFDFEILLKEGLKVRQFKCSSDYNCIINEIGSNKVRISALLNPGKELNFTEKLSVGQFILEAGSKGVMLFNSESVRQSEVSNQYGINLFTVKNYAIRVD